jgi:hypothetical protein
MFTIIHTAIRSENTLFDIRAGHGKEREEKRREEKRREEKRRKENKRKERENNTSHTCRPQRQHKIIGRIPRKTRIHIGEHHLNTWQHKTKGTRQHEAKFVTRRFAWRFHRQRIRVHAATNLGILESYISIYTL